MDVNIIIKLVINDIILVINNSKALYIYSY